MDSKVIHRRHRKISIFIFFACLILVLGTGCDQKQASSHTNPVFTPMKNPTATATPTATPTPTPTPTLAPGTTPTAVPSGSSSFIASIDTMKVSRDTQTNPLSDAEIQNIVQVSASLHVNYITVDTNWDYADYMQKWTDAVHSLGLHVWFRSHPNQWENTNGASGIMTPAMFESAERTFIQQHPALFKSGDIFDPCPEPEQGSYWTSKYGAQWTPNAPNDATRDFNRFLRDTMDVADQAFANIGIANVITNIHSTNSWFASHPDAFEQATVNKFGLITIDSYPDTKISDPAAAAQARVSELQTIENLWHVPIVIGEAGYSNDMNVGDDQQHQVLKAELNAMSGLSYIAGLNYWVGAGSTTSGGYTYVITKKNGGWTLRPAAYDLQAYFTARLG